MNLACDFQYILRFGAFSASRSSRFSCEARRSKSDGHVTKVKSQPQVTHSFEMLLMVFFVNSILPSLSFLFQCVFYKVTITYHCNVL